MRCVEYPTSPNHTSTQALMMGDAMLADQGLTSRGRPFFVDWRRQADPGGKVRSTTSEALATSGS